MLSCTLNGKTYCIDYVSTRALLEIDEATEVLSRLQHILAAAARGEDVSGETLTVKKALGVMVDWFCVLFRNQFTPEDVYNYYPSDCVLNDIASAIIAVNGRATEALSSFPTKPAAAQATNP